MLSCGLKGMDSSENCHYFNLLPEIVKSDGYYSIATSEVRDFWGIVIGHTNFPVSDWSHYPRSSENLEMKAFEKFENAVFFKIFKIPSDRQLILV